MSNAILEVVNLSKRFGGLAAVTDVDFQIQQGSISAIIGPNGAGKTTTFHMLSGIERPTSGSIRLGDKDTTGLPPHLVCAAGIGRTFQLTEVFKRMTVAENVMVGGHSHGRGGLIASGLRLPVVRREERRLRDQAEELLHWVGLDDVVDAPAGDLPFGRQRLLELARAMATHPKVLLLDEPASGLDVAETDNLAKLVRDIRDQGVTVLLIEHDMRFVMNLAEWVVVLDHGRCIAQDVPAEIRRSEVVLEAYLGGVE